MRPSAWLVGALLLGLAVPALAHAEERPLAEATLDMEASRFGPYRPMFLPLKPERPKGARVPTGLVEPRYAQIRWGEGRGLLFALETAEGREQLWVDRDLDGDVADETPLPWAGRGRGIVQDVRVHVAYQGEDITVTIRLSRAAVGPTDRVQIVPWVHRRGTVELEGRLRTVALIDGNADLRFDDPKRDAAYVDLDGDGHLETRTGSPERIAPGSPFRLGDRGFVLEVVEPSGRQVRFAASKETPPRTPRTWLGSAAPKAGRKQTPPAESLDDILKRIEAEKDKTYVQRYAAIRLLGRVGTKRAMDELFEIHKRDPDLSLRAAAVRAIGNPAYLPFVGSRLQELSSDKQVAVANGAISALHDMGHPDREAIYRHLLANAPSSVAGQAARYLAYVGTPEALTAVRRAWEGASTGAVRNAIYQGLRSLPGGPPLEVMDRAARDDYASLRGTALRDLRVLDPDRAAELAVLASEARPVVDHLAKAVIDVLSAVGDGKSVRALLFLAVDASSSVEAYLVRRLAPLRGEDAIAVLQKALASREVVHRRVASQVLAGVVRPEVTSALLRRVKREKEEEVLIAMLEALGDHDDPRALEVLLRYAKKRNATVRRAAIRALARVGFGDEKARRHLLSLLTAKDWQDRILALDAAGASGDVALCGKVLPSLGDAQWQVRLAAAEAVAALRCPQSIERLIARLEREEEARVKDAVAEALYRITGMNLYDEAAVWRRWWSEHGATFRLPDRVDALPPPDTGGTEAGFYGIPVRSNRAIFVIDQSGSMSAEDLKDAKTTGNRLDAAIRETLAATRLMSDRDRVNVILFHTTVHPWRDKLQRLTKKSRKILEKHLIGKVPTGGTNLYDALERALLDPDVDTVFLLSDGAPGAGKYVQKDDILRAVKRLNQTRRIRIHTISIGMDSALMRELAAEHGGQYLRR